MTDLEDRVKALLVERARDYPADPSMPRRVATRSRVRRTLVGAGIGLGVAAAIVVGAAALRAFVPPDETANPTPSVSPSPSAALEPWRGIWPHATREEGEAAQAASDAGELGSAWQLDAGEVARRYARQELGFAEVHFDESFDIAEEDSPGPFVVHVISCAPRDLVEWPPVCAAGAGLYTEITIERLLREDRTGLWFVTEAPGPEPTQEVEPPPSGSGYPSTFVGLTNDRDLVLVRLADGEVERVLLEGGGRQLTLGPGALTPDGSFVYVTDWAGRDPRILRVPLDGGPPEETATGSTPAVGPDGRIAYAGCGGGGCGTELFVEAANGAIVRFDVSASDEERVGPVAWLPDGRVAFSVSYLGDSNPDIRVLDPDAPPRFLLDLAPLGPSDPEEGWTPLGWHRPTAGLAVDSYCCTGSATDPVETEVVWSVDPETGEHGPAVVEGSGLLPTLDRTGRWFLLVRVSPGDGTGEELFLRERDGDFRTIATGYVEVAW